MDQNGIDTLHIRKYNQLFDGGVIADISFGIGIFGSPLHRRFSKEGHIKQIGFVGIHKVDLWFGQFRGNQVFLNGIGMNMVVYFGKCTLEVPIQF